jgi:hypothetical protein
VARGARCIKNLQWADRHVAGDPMKGNGDAKGIGEDKANMLTIGYLLFKSFVRNDLGCSLLV